MSFDIFLQGFKSGEARPDGLELALAQLEPFVTRREPSMGFLQIEYADSSADVYFGENDLMVNHVAGADLWDVLVSAAREADWVIMPTGCPVALTRPEQRLHLPEVLADNVAVVADGQGLVELFSR